MIFYVGIHMVAHTWRFERCMVSVNRLRGRKSDFRVNEWIMDSGAFTELFNHGRYRSSVSQYAGQIRRWSRCGNMLAAVSQDYMCEPFILARTGLTTEEHQRLTIQRYDELLPLTEGIRIMPVLQGYWPEEYVDHIRQYGDRLTQGMWVGVGSVCKRNARVDAIEQVLVAIKDARPDLLLHGFGVKTTALQSSIVRGCLHSADSMAWSRAERWRQGDASSWAVAQKFSDDIESQSVRKRHFRPTLF